MRRGSIGATERSGFAVAAIERIVRLLAMHDTVGIVVPPTPPERCNLAFVAGSGVLPVLRGRVVPAFVCALICCSRTAVPFLSFALSSVMPEWRVTTVRSACAAAMATVIVSTSCQLQVGREEIGLRAMGHRTVLALP